MRLSSLFFAFAMLIAGTSALGADLSAPYTPTRAEWLQSKLYSRITQITDAWQRRVGVSVVAFQKEQQVVIIITSANGQTEASQQEKASYVSLIESLSKSVIGGYDWAKDIKVVVQFI